MLRRQKCRGIFVKKRCSHCIQNDRFKVAQGDQIRTPNYSCCLLDHPWGDKDSFHPISFPLVLLFVFSQKKILPLCTL